MQNNIHKDFILLFYEKESKELRGSKNRNLWVLIGILLLTFLAVGFATGSLDYLNRKMNNPFIKWVTIAIPATDAEQVQSYKEELNMPDLKKAYLYDTITSYRNYFFAIRYKDKPNKDLVRGRTIDIKDNLLKEILNSKNKISGEGFADRNDVGLIVSQDFLREFGYNEHDPVVFMDMLRTETDEYDQTRVVENRAVPIPIRAVVSSLPGTNKVAFTPYFYNQRASYRHQNKSGNPFDPLSHESEVNAQQLIYFINSSDNGEQEQFIKSIESFFNNHNEYKNYNINIYKTDNEYLSQKGINIHINFTNPPDSVQIIDAIDNLVQASPEMASFKRKSNQALKYFRFYEYDLRPHNDEVDADYLSITLKRLDKVRDLRKYILSNHENLEIDISKVETLENYNFVSYLTYIISTVLIIFSILSICLFVSNLLRTHLDKIKMNLGTFKAFGLDNKTLQKIYTNMVFRMILLAMFIGFAISTAIGMLGGSRLLLRLLGGQPENQEYYFKPLAISTLITVVIILSITLLVVRGTMSTTLKRTPGDLIYDRE